MAKDRRVYWDPTKQGAAADAAQKTIQKRVREMKPASRYRDFSELGRDLLEITKKCRPDMHEPDEQEVDAFVVGRRFDNSGMDTEMMVAIVNYTTGKRDDFNLASLIAMARIGAAVVDLQMTIAGVSGEAIREKLKRGKKGAAR